MQTELLIAIIIAAIGLIGTIIPGLPGIPLMLISVLGYIVYDKMMHFSVSFIVIVSILGAIGIISEYLLAYLGAKFFGASRYSAIGAVVGTFVGLIFFSFLFPPMGLIIGAIGGAIIGEYLNSKDLDKAIKAAWGTVLGLISGSVFRFLIALTIFIMFIVKVLR